MGAASRKANLQHREVDRLPGEGAWKHGMADAITRPGRAPLRGWIL